MKSLAIASLLVAFAPKAFADGNPHMGLLTNSEMAIVYANASHTQQIFLKDQQLSACWPYDALQTGVPTGVAYCKIETPQRQQKFVTMLRGPDLYCPYVRSDYCEITPTDWSK